MGNRAVHHSPSASTTDSQFSYYSNHHHSNHHSNHQPRSITFKSVRDDNNNHKALHAPGSMSLVGAGMMKIRNNVVQPESILGIDNSTATSTTSAAPTDRSHSNPYPDSDQTRNSIVPIRRNSLERPKQEMAHMDSLCVKAWMMEQEATALMKNLSAIGEAMKPTAVALAKRKSQSHKTYPVWHQYYGFQREVDGARALDMRSMHLESWARVNEPPRELVALRFKLKKDLDLPDWALNSIIVSFHYDGDRTYMPAHHDVTSRLEAHSHVVILSLGAAREFVVCSSDKDQGKYDKNDMEISKTWKIEHGDLLVIGKETNEKHCIAVPRDANPTKARILICFRTISQSFVLLDGDPLPSHLKKRKESEKVNNLANFIPSKTAASASNPIAPQEAEGGVTTRGEELQLKNYNNFSSAKLSNPASTEHRESTKPSSSSSSSSSSSGRHTVAAAAAAVEKSSSRSGSGSNKSSSNRGSGSVKGSGSSKKMVGVVGSLKALISRGIGVIPTGSSPTADGTEATSIAAAGADRGDENQQQQQQSCVQVEQKTAQYANGTIRVFAAVCVCTRGFSDAGVHEHVADLITAREKKRAESQPVAGSHVANGQESSHDHRSRSGSSSTGGGNDRVYVPILDYVGETHNLEERKAKTMALLGEVSRSPIANGERGSGGGGGEVERSSGFNGSSGMSTEEQAKLARHIRRLRAEEDARRQAEEEALETARELARAEADKKNQSRRESKLIRRSIELHEARFNKSISASLSALSGSKDLTAAPGVDVDVDVGQAADNGTTPNGSLKSQRKDAPFDATEIAVADTADTAGAAVDVIPKENKIVSENHEKEAMVLAERQEKLARQILREKQEKEEREREEERELESARERARAQADKLKIDRRSSKILRRSMEIKSSKIAHAADCSSGFGKIEEEEAKDEKEADTATERQAKIARRILREEAEREERKREEELALESARERARAEADKIKANRVALKLIRRSVELKQAPVVPDGSADSFQEEAFLNRALAAIAPSINLSTEDDEAKAAGGRGGEGGGGAEGSESSNIPDTVVVVSAAAATSDAGVPLDSTAGDIKELQETENIDQGESDEERAKEQARLARQIQRERIEREQKEEREEEQTREAARERARADADRNRVDRRNSKITRLSSQEKEPAPRSSSPSSSSSGMIIEGEDGASEEQKRDPRSGVGRPGAGSAEKREREEEEEEERETRGDVVKDAGDFIHKTISRDDTLPILLAHDRTQGLTVVQEFGDSVESAAEQCRLRQQPPQRASNGSLCTTAITASTAVDLGRQQMKTQCRSKRWGKIVVNSRAQELKEKEKEQNQQQQQEKQQEKQQGEGERQSLVAEAKTAAEGASEVAATANMETKSASFSDKSDELRNASSSANNSRPAAIALN